MNRKPKLEMGMFVITKNDKVGFVCSGKIYFLGGGYIRIEKIRYPDYIRYIGYSMYNIDYIIKNINNIKFKMEVLGIHIIWRYEDSISETGKHILNNLITKKGTNTMEHLFYNSDYNLLYKYKPKIFTSKDLETGMFFIIEGECFVVVGDKIVSECGSIYSKNMISEDMQAPTGKHIEKVYKDCCSFSDAKNGLGTQVYPVPLPKLTLSQIKNMIGFDFELTDE